MRQQLKKLEQKLYAFGEREDKQKQVCNELENKRSELEAEKKK